MNIPKPFTSFLLAASPPEFEPALFFFNDTATTEIYTLSLHDALPISGAVPRRVCIPRAPRLPCPAGGRRSEEHTSELQSRPHLVCRLLLEKKKKSVWSPPRIFRLTHDSSFGPLN